jgi:CheY-like chemotaxis protein
MKRRLQLDTNPTRVTGRWMPGNLSHRHRLGVTSAGELERSSRTTAEPVASPGALLAGGATELTTTTTGGRAPKMTLASEAREAPRGEASNGGGIRESLAPAGHCPKLVIADDDPVIRLTLGMSLGSEFEIAGEAADSEEAIELARVSQPDAALVDVVMPKGGGLHAVRGILEVAPDTAIVMLSGYRADGVVRELIQAGAIAYRHKGVAPRALADALTESIKVHTAERRESAWTILAWYCVSLDRRSRRRGTARLGWHQPHPDSNHD